MSHVIRTTMRPDDEITVSDAEYENLLELGLIYDGTPPVEPVDFYDQTIADRIGGGEATPAALRAAFAPVAHLLYVDSYGADPTGATDSTAAVSAALAAMPIKTVYDTPPSGGASATYPVGTLVFGAGTYKLGSASDVGNLGPFVNVVGAGTNATVLAYHGSGDCLRVYNGIKPSSDTFDTLAALHGRIDGFTIDGANSGIGACGLRYGDTEGGTLGPNLVIRDFAGALAAPTLTIGASDFGGLAGGQYWWRVTALTGATLDQESTTSNEVSATAGPGGAYNFSWTQVAGAKGYRLYRSDTSGYPVAVATLVGATNTTYLDSGASLNNVGSWPLGTGGSVGLALDNQFSWTENIWGRLSLYNCQVAVLINGTGGSSGDPSFMYNELSVKVYSMAGQNGLVLQNGAVYNNGTLRLRANMLNAPAAQTNALVVFRGTARAGHVGANNHCSLSYCRLDIQAEANGTGSNGPTTVLFSSNTDDLMARNMGQIIFGNGTWAASNRTSAESAHANFSHLGQVLGDSNLATASTTTLTWYGTP